MRIFARAINRFLCKPLLKVFGKNRVVSASVYGQKMLIPAEHSLPEILVLYPQYNRPLGLAAEAIASTSKSGIPLTIIDVGANVGETAAVVERHCPNRYFYLCIEPDTRIAELCRFNHRDNPRVAVRECFIGEDEGAKVYLRDDGRANPSTIRADVENGSQAASGELFRLDTVAAPFASSNHGLSLIKVDTEGYDFSVLRSARELLKNYRSAIYFEWFPERLLSVGESVWSGFEFLKGLGYRYFVLFHSVGNYYCKLVDPDGFLLQSLSAVAQSDPSLQYFDVFASTELEVCDALVEGCIRALGLDRLEMDSGLSVR